MKRSWEEGAALLYTTRLPLPHGSQPQIPAPLFPPAPKIPFATCASKAWLAFFPKSIEIIEKCTHSYIHYFSTQNALRSQIRDGSAWLLREVWLFSLWKWESQITWSSFPGSISAARGSFLPGLARAAAWLEEGISSQARRALKSMFEKIPNMKK